MRCSACNAERATKGERIPGGWKRLPDRILCGECLHKLYALRAITIPIVGPIGDADDDTWPALRDALRTCWIECTRAANWILRELWVRDSGLRSQPKITRMEPVYLYPEVRAAFPALPTASVVALIHAAEGKYRKSRLDLWRGAVSLPTFRYPVPLPVHNASWSVAVGEGGQLLLSVRLDKKRWTLRLRGGQEFRRQRFAAEQIAKGEAIQGELAILRVNANTADHRNGDTPATRVMAKMVAWLPRVQRVAGENECSIRTSKESLLILVNKEEKVVWTYHAMHLQRALVRFDREQQILSDDTKAERRSPKKRRDRLHGRRGLLAQLRGSMVGTEIQRAAKFAVQYAARRNAGLVRYDDTDRGFGSLPWHQLAGEIERRCIDHGIRFERSGDEEIPAPARSGAIDTSADGA